ncbi:DUF2487 family protein [Paenibacillus sp. CAU 1782]
MKFSDISLAEWDELQPYLDTCLLPVTGMNGAETPPEATLALENLRDLLDLIEIPFKGRVVTYPAWHYTTDGEGLTEALAKWISSLRSTGFKYVLLATASPSLDLSRCGADAVISPGNDGGQPEQGEVSLLIRSLWNGK